MSARRSARLRGEVPSDAGTDANATESSAASAPQKVPQALKQLADHNKAGAYYTKRKRDEPVVVAPEPLPKKPKTQKATQPKPPAPIPALPPDEPSKLPTDTEERRQWARELHAPHIRPSETRHVVTKGKDDVWAADTTYMFTRQPEIVALNDGYKFIFVVIDCFTRYTWAVPMKSIKAESAWNAFTQILNDSGRRPDNLWVDQGSEFIGNRKKLDDAGIVMYHTYNQGKSVMAERMHRTIREKLGRRMTELNTQKWVDLLPEIMKEYNTKDVHSAIRMTPLEASKLDAGRAQLLWFHQYNAERVGPKYQMGDWVRIWREPTKYQKRAGSRRWQDEKFLVVEVRSRTRPVTYRIQDEEGEVIIGSYYENELQRTAPPELARRRYNQISEVLKRRENRTDGSDEYLLRVDGQPVPIWYSEADLGVRDTALVRSIYERRSKT